MEDASPERTNSEEIRQDLSISRNEIVSNHSQGGILKRMPDQES